MSLGSARYYNEYRQNEICTSSQGKLILMMYDGAIKNAQMALNCLAKRDISGRSVHLRKTRDIINELSLALDQEKSPQVAKHLEDLYQFMMRQLTLANIRGEAKPVESVLQILGTLQEAWEQVVEKVNLDGSSKAEPAKSIKAHC
ncbi:MAG: flagellar export chaperone FliS [Nitrospinales bacterium]